MTVRELYLIISVKDKSLKSKTVRVVFRHMTKQGSQDTHMDFKVILQAWTIPKRQNTPNFSSSLWTITKQGQG